MNDGRPLHQFKYLLLCAGTVPDLLARSLYRTCLPQQSSGSNTSVFVICQHRTSSGLSDPQFINSSAELRPDLTYSVSIKSATTKGFL